MDVLVHVLGQRLSILANSRNFAKGTQEFVRFIFNLDESWNDLVVFAQFRQGDNAYNLYLNEETHDVYLPPEITTGECTLMLYGTGDTVIGTTNCLTLKIIDNKYLADAQGTEITKSLYNQLVDIVKATTGSPLKATTASEMTNHNKIYVYVGNESGYTNGHWYYYDGEQWVDGGAYNASAVNTDTTLTVSGAPADAKATGDAIKLKADIASPTFTGTPKAPTPSSETSNTQIATTKFVKDAIDDKAIMISVTGRTLNIIT